MVIKRFPSVSGPFAKLHHTLSSGKFRAFREDRQTVYSLLIKDSLSQQVYDFRIPASCSENGIMTVFLNRAGFAPSAAIPSVVEQAASSRLHELHAYLRAASIKPTKSLREADNSSMAQDMDEMKRLGDEMAAMKTNSEWEEMGMVPDPIQTLKR